MRHLFYVPLGLLGVALVALLLSGKSTPERSAGPDGLRIVSLAPSITEILFALDVGNCIAGVSDHCDYPAEAKNIERVGGLDSPSVEKLLALSPDLMIATGIQRAEAAEALRRAEIRILRVKTGNFSELFEAVREIGREVGKPQCAAKLVASMQSELNAIAERHRDIPCDRRPRVFVELWNDPIITAGARSFVDELIRCAGGVNVAHELDSAYPTVNPEKVVEWDPDVVVLGYMNPEQVEDTLAGRIGWSGVAAVRSGNIVSDICSDLLLRPGPRLTQGVRALNRRLHGAAVEETAAK